MCEKPTARETGVGSGQDKHWPTGATPETPRRRGGGGSYRADRGGLKEGWEAGLSSVHGRHANGYKLSAENQVQGGICHCLTLSS